MMEDQKNELRPEDWDVAKSYLDQMMNLYKSIGPTGWFGLSLMKPLERRYEGGERTRELYDEIMKLE